MARTRSPRRAPAAGSTERDVQPGRARVAAPGGALGPGPLSPAALLALQRAAGNQAVLRRLGRAPAPAPGGPPAVGAAARVQRRVGFEFETLGIDQEWRLQGRNRDDEHFASIKHTKKKLLPTPNALGGISADNGKVEFATDPLSTWPEVRATIGELRGLVANFRGKTVDFNAGQNAFAQAASGFAQHRLVAKKALKTKPQATIGVSALGIDTLFTKLEAMAQRPANPTEARLANPTLLYHLGDSTAHAKAIIDLAIERWEKGTGTQRGWS